VKLRARPTCRRGRRRRRWTSLDQRLADRLAIRAPRSAGTTSATSSMSGRSSAARPRTAPSSFT
jgi:hypothetical protein